MVLCVKNVCVEPIFISLNSILAEFVMMIRIVSKRFQYSTITKSVLILAKNTNPNETPRFAASHLRLRCLYMFPFRMHSACSTSA